MKRLMRYGLGVALAAMAAGGVWMAMTSSAATPPQTVEKVDLRRYMGRWYEIASMPMVFQRRCEGNTTATYALKPNGRVSVLNACDTAKGRIDARAEARVEDADSGARLKVSFFKLFAWWQYWVGGDYWIVGLEPQEYRYAIVGHPARRYGWVLSRTPALSAADRRAVLGRLQALGYEPGQFMTTPQAGGLQEKRPFSALSAP